MSAAVYNVCLTSLPVIAFSLLDKPLAHRTLLTVPELYNRSTSLTQGAFWKAILDAVVHGGVCFFFSLYARPSSQVSPS